MSEPVPVLQPAAFELRLAEGHGEMHTRHGEIWELPVPRWTAEAGPGDLPLLSRCRGRTLDVGCGPGRMTAALGERGIDALGVDVSALAVTMTRSRGAAALHRDIFDLGPSRSWEHVLLADGNVGIGGDPVRLLWLCRRLLTPAGSILVDLAPPGRGLHVTTARLVGSAGPGEWFAWALVDPAALTQVAVAAGLEVIEVWQAVDGRWQAELGCSASWPPPGQRAR